MGKVERRHFVPAPCRVPVTLLSVLCAGDTSYESAHFRDVWIVAPPRVARPLRLSLESRHRFACRDATVPIRKRASSSDSFAIKADLAKLRLASHVRLMRGLCRFRP
jgi:hypothetical protein